ncbi:phospholipase/carboxylesterase [Mytilus galloprovincialis]|uniref:palmitoyl-protein hydrolase n=2 Tax=Mytilus TaxID=6548 RepID=A0A8B6FXZ9_MYTGA|nr:phospholipase/carboxylesterase [Mytilus galloprovincialis]
MALSLMPRIVPQTKDVCKGAVFFLHGSGDTGIGIQDWLRSILDDDFKFPHLKVIFPTAPLRPYTPNNGGKSYVWFDRKNISPFVSEHETLDETAKSLSQLIQTEVDGGIPLSRIIIGGFSMGGAMSYHMAYRYFPQVPGVFALSSFLNNGSSVFKALETVSDKSKLPKLFCCHGDLDQLVLPEWGLNTSKQLQDIGISTEFHKFNFYHEMNFKEISMLREWILKLIPENSSQL